jgi:hypothetical protein
MASVFFNNFQYEKSGDINTVYSFFNTYNYTGKEAASSYALPFAGFIFRPRLNDVEDILSRKRIVWDFGDNTVSEAITGRHSYRYPGKYEVTCYLYDRDGNSYYDSFTQRVDVKNYITDAITLTGNYTASAYLTSGKYANPITVMRSTSYQTYENGIPRLTITPYASGATNNFFDIGADKKHYGHLYPYSSFYLLLTGLKGLTEFVEINSFETTSTPLYCRLSNTEIVNCSKADRGAFFCGTSGYRDVYFKSDLPTNAVNLFFGYQPSMLLPAFNTTTVGVSTKIVNNEDFSHLSITANGIDKENNTDTVFTINKNKFSNTDISFVVRVKDGQNFTLKNLPVLTDINLTLTDGTRVYPAIFTDLSYTLPELSSGGFYKGACRLSTSQTVSNAYISAFVPASFLQGTVPLTGISNSFNIYPESGIYNIAKKGEDIDFTQKFKDISFQSLFLDQKILFDEYIQNIFGTLSSDQTSIGKLTYEKIKNFVDNNSIVDYANIDKFLSIVKELNIQDRRFNSVNYRYPGNFSRLVDLLSIKQTKLFGTQNKFSESFNSHGYINNDIYGYNLGDEITVSDIITPGESIVAYERFSGVYTKLNTNQPMKVFKPGIVEYKIRDYEDIWGWGLVLPEDGYGAAISNYYFFYKYIPRIEGSIKDGIINFNDFNTTLQYTASSYNQWSEKDGVIANLLSNALYKGLDLIK